MKESNAPLPLQEAVRYCQKGVDQIGFIKKFIHKDIGNILYLQKILIVRLELL